MTAAPIARIPAIPIGIMKFDEFCRLMGISYTSGQKWRRMGYFGKLPYIENRPFITEEQAHQFFLRVKSGEFARMQNEQDKLNKI